RGRAAPRHRVHEPPPELDEVVALDTAHLPNVGRAHEGEELIAAELGEREAALRERRRRRVDDALARRGLLFVRDPRVDTTVVTDRRSEGAHVEVETFAPGGRGKLVVAMLDLGERPAIDT